MIFGYKKNTQEIKLKGNSEYKRQGLTFSPSTSFDDSVAYYDLVLFKRKTAHALDHLFESLGQHYNAFCFDQLVDE